MVTDVEYNRALTYIEGISRLQKNGNLKAQNLVVDGKLVELNIYEKMGYGGYSFIDLIPEAGGLKDMVMLKFFDETDIGPTSRHLPATGEEVVVFGGSNKVSVISKNQDGNLTIKDGDEVKVLTDKDGNPIKDKTGDIFSIGEYVPHKVVVFKEAELIQELDTIAAKYIGDDGFQIVGNNNVTNNITNNYYGNTGSRSTGEVAEKTTEATSEAIAKKTGISWEKVKKVLKYVGVDNQFLATIFNPYAIGGVAKSNLLKTYGGVVSFRITLHAIGYYFFIHKLCAASNSEEGGQDPEIDFGNYLNLIQDGKWEFSPCFYPLWPLRLFGDLLSEKIANRLNKSQQNYCKKYDTDVNGERTKSKECAGLFQKIDAALHAVDDKNNGVWCDLYKDNTSEEVFKSQYAEAMVLIDDEQTEGQQVSTADIMEFIGFNGDEALNIFKESPSWDEFDTRCGANSMACHPELLENTPTDVVRIEKREGENGETEYEVEEGKASTYDW